MIQYEASPDWIHAHFPTQREIKEIPWPEYAPLTWQQTAKDPAWTRRPTLRPRTPVEQILSDLDEQRQPTEPWGWEVDPRDFELEVRERMEELDVSDITEYY